MRRIVAILILCLVMFLAIYGLFPPAKAVVNDFAVKVAGPTAFNVLTGTYNLIITTIGIAGFVALTGIFFFSCGIIFMKLWRKVDLGVSGWSLRRRAKEMGTGGLISTVPTTPSYATTRPETKVVAKVAEVVPQVTEEELKEETSTA